MINKFKQKLKTDTHFAELLKGSSIAFVLRVVGIIAGYIFTLLITRGYGAEAMGVFTLFQIFLIIRNFEISKKLNGNNPVEKV